MSVASGLRNWSFGNTKALATSPSVLAIADLLIDEMGEAIKGGHHSRGDLLVVEVQGRSGTPPYIVRWADSGKLALYFPGRDARLKQLATSR